MTKLKRIFRKAVADNITGESAKVAYYFFLSLFPLILVLFALTGLLGGERAFDWIMTQIQGRVPPQAAGLLRGVVREITSRPEAGTLGIGLLLTLWAASGGVTALADGLNRMYDVREDRGFLKKRGIALLLLVAGLVLLVGGALAIIAGVPIIRSLGLGPAAELGAWILAFVLVVAQFALVYYVLPNRDQSRSKATVLVGAVVGALVWLLATTGFQVYVANFGRYRATYGAIGAVIVLLLWLYLTALAILFGGEVASVLEGVRSERRGEEGMARAA
jgi:membrane protein